ncbi:MAG: hemolysin family protein [Bdellovibrionales bacterium]
MREVLAQPSSRSGVQAAERMLLSNVLKLRERKVSDCFVHRTDIISADIDNGMQGVIELMALHAHSRIPIYRETLDDVIGMIHMKDVVHCLAQGQERTIGDLLRPVLYVAHSMPAAKLMLQMLQSRQHMAMVVDEFGGIDGLVTIENLVEQVVGEIEDEHDLPPSPPIVSRADGVLLVDARIALEDFQNKTGYALPPQEAEGVDTLGGYVANHAGHIPHLGEIVVCAGLAFDVQEMDQGSVKRLRVRPARRSEKSSPAPNQDVPQQTE